MTSKRFCYFKRISEDSANELINMTDANQVRESLADLYNDYLNFLGDDSTETDFNYRRDIILDLLGNMLLFTKKNNFDAQKVSCTLECSFEIFQHSVDKILSFEKSFDYMREVLLRHSLFRPPHSVLIFNLDEMKLVIDALVQNFYQTYTLYIKSFSPHVEYEIGTFNMFKTRFPQSMNLVDGDAVDKDNLSVLDQYNKDKEIKLSKEEILEIMRGESSHNIPEWKKQEIIAKFLERERQEKVDRVLKKELEKLQEKYIKKVQEQDDWFNEKVASLKIKK